MRINAAYGFADEVRPSFREAASGARSFPEIHHQFHEHAHPDRQRRIREIIMIAVQRRIRRIGRRDPDKEETTGDFFEIEGEILAAHYRAAGGTVADVAERLPDDLRDISGHF